MNVVIYIPDLYPENAHLMPWRAPLEVATHWHGDDDSVSVWSGTDDVWKMSKGEILISWILVKYIPRVGRDLSKFQRLLSDAKIDLLYFPVDFARLYNWAPQLECKPGFRIVWYLPGGFFSVAQCFRSLRYLHWKKVLPYFIQALFPKQYFFGTLMKYQERNIICFSDYSAEKVRSFCPENRVFTALPGSHCPRSSEIRSGPGVVPYFLFWGPPDPRRGIEALLKAFETVARKHRCRLHLCLQKNGNADDIAPLLAKVKESLARKQIDVFAKKLERSDLDSEIQNAFAVVEPSLIMTSEIPLAVIESVRMGKIVLTSGPDGAGAFVSSCGLVSKHGDADALAENMIALLTNPVLYRNLTETTNEIAEHLPSWEETARVWFDAGTRKTSEDIPEESLGQTVF